jgi:hypothetical protein
MGLRARVLVCHGSRDDGLLSLREVQDLLV